jgi:hypothetical protein
MTAPRMTAKERADRAPMPTLYGNAGTNIRQPRTRMVGGRDEPYNVTEPDAYTHEPRCAIVGPCLTGAHTTPAPEPPEYMTHEEAPE